MKNDDVFFLISEGEITMILSEVREVLEDLEEILRTKKFNLSSKEGGTIRFDSGYLTSSGNHKFFKI